MTLEEARAAVLRVTFDHDLVAEVSNIIEAAIATERERCAWVADDAARTWNGEHGRSVACNIGQAIRNRCLL